MVLWCVVSYVLSTHVHPETEKESVYEHMCVSLCVCLIFRDRGRFKGTHVRA